MPLFDSILFYQSIKIRGKHMVYVITGYINRNTEHGDISNKKHV